MRRELSDDAVEQIQADLFAGRKIQAIKVYRTATGVGLAESLAFINAVEERLRQESPERFATPQLKAGGCLIMAVCSIAVLAALVAAAVLLMRG